MRGFSDWLKDDGATAAVEAAFMFPLLMLILCGTVDTGLGVVMNQKLTNSTHTVCDLLSRGTSVSRTEVDDAIIAGQLALKPYSTASLGFDIAAIKFLTVSKTPTVQWRRTTNMSADNTLVTNSNGLGAQNEGVLAVTGVYNYHPMFTSYFQETVSMKVQAFGRSRKSSDGFITCSTGGSTCS